MSMFIGKAVYRHLSVVATSRQVPMIRVCVILIASHTLRREEATCASKPYSRQMFSS